MGDSQEAIDQRGRVLHGWRRTIQTHRVSLRHKSLPALVTSKDEAVREYQEVVISKESIKAEHGNNINDLLKAREQCHYRLLIVIAHLIEIKKRIQTSHCSIILPLCNTNAGKTCGACLDGLPINDIVRTSCKHYYHSRCLHAWLAQGSRTCPQCRGEITSDILNRETLEINARADIKKRIFDMSREIFPDSQRSY